MKNRIKSGLSSGEGLIYNVRDPVWEKESIKEKGRVVDYQDVIVDAGESDKSNISELRLQYGSTANVQRC